MFYSFKLFGMSEREYRFDACPECKVREEDGSEKKLYQYEPMHGWKQRPRLILIAGILAIVGGLISVKKGKKILVLAGILILFSVVVYTFGLQNELPKMTNDLHNYPYNLVDFPEVQLFSSGSYSHPTYPIPAWNYSSYLYLGFWIDLIATVLVFISANRR